MASNSGPIISHGYDAFAKYFNATKLGGGGDSVGYGSVTQLSDGSFIATWDTMVGYSSSNIYGQRFSSSGEKIGSTLSLGENSAPDVIAYGDGGFAVARSDFRHTGWNHAAIVDFYDSSNNLIKSIVVSDEVDGAHYAPKVAQLEGGGFVVIWNNGNQNFQGQIIDTSLNLSGNNFDLSGSDNDNNGSVVALSTGGFIANRGYYDALGNFENKTLSVDDGYNDVSDGSTTFDICRAGDKIIVVWVDSAQTGIFAKVFSESGNIVVNDFAVAAPVRDSETFNLSLPSVHAWSDGSFVVAYSQDGRIKSKVFNADGTVKVEGFILDETVDTAGNLGTGAPDLITTSEGRAIYIWSSDVDQSSRADLYAKSIDFNPSVSLSTTVNASISETIDWFSDPDGDVLSYTLDTTGTTGSASIENGVLSYSHDKIVPSADSFVVTATDPSNASVDLRVNIAIDWSTAGLDITNIQYGGSRATVALRDDGTSFGIGAVYGGSSWTELSSEGSSSSIDRFTISNNYATAILADNGTVTTSGDAWAGGDSSSIDFDGPLNNLKVTKIIEGNSSFVAIRDDGSILIWGWIDTDTFDFDGPDNDLKVIDVVSLGGRFAVVRSDYSIVDLEYGNFSLNDFDFNGTANDRTIIEWGCPR